MNRASSLCALGLLLMTVQCNREHVGTAVGPPLTIAWSDASPPRAAQPEAAVATSDFPPVDAEFMALVERQPLHETVVRCGEVVVAVIAGSARAFGETLTEGDTLWAAGVTELEVAGEGSSLLARTHPSTCAQPRGRTVRVVRAGATPDLAWADGTMRARPQVEPPLSDQLYAGRLEGSARVAEHTHEGSWEILCAAAASGTVVVGGREQRVGAGTVVVIPPGTPHAWNPDPQSRLRAVQLYMPPGPEQRFRALAAAAAKGGAAAEPRTPRVPGTDKGAGGDSGVR